VRYDPVMDGMKGNVTKAKLYNLATDIGEKKDLIAIHPEKAKSLQTAWDEWNELNVPALWGGGCHWLRQCLIGRHKRTGRASGT
jgi:hypothetical protein